jgi:GAF domain-containing protein
MNRRVKSITVVPISWKGTSIGAIFLRTFRETPGFSDADIQFCQVVASLTAKALRNAHRFEQLQRRQGGAAADNAGRERAALVSFLRLLLEAHARREAEHDDSVLPRASSEELERLVEVAMTVLGQESAAP